MNELQNRNSRNTSAFAIADGEIASVYVNGDYCWLYSSTGEVEISVNDGPYAPCPVGLIHKGVVGRDDIGRVQIKNVSGGDIDVVVISGKGSMDISGQVTITNPVFSIAPRSFGFKFVQITASQDFNGCQSIVIENTGATDITVTTSEGVSTIPGGKIVSVSAPGSPDDLGNVTVDATGGSADITYMI